MLGVGLRGTGGSQGEGSRQGFAAIRASERWRVRHKRRGRGALHEQAGREHAFQGRGGRGSRDPAGRGAPRPPARRGARRPLRRERPRPAGSSGARRSARRATAMPRSTAAAMRSRAGSSGAASARATWSGCGCAAGRRAADRPDRDHASPAPPGCRSTPTRRSSASPSALATPRPRASSPARRSSRSATCPARS